MYSTKKKGNIGEVIAIKYLQKHNYSIISTNFIFGKFGEIDIVAYKNSITVFIEVKYRNNISYGFPEESINSNKLRKCKKTIEYYCKKHKLDFENIRFDVITILKGVCSYKLKHYKNIGIDS